MPLWLFPLFIGPLLVYWGAGAWLSRRLALERRRAGDPRPVPEMFDFQTSHRWGGILLGEDTRTYRPSVRRAFLIARIALGATLVGFFASMVVASQLPPAPSPAVEDRAPPPVTIPADRSNP